MALPLLKIAPLTQNARVKSFPVGGDESPRLSPLDLGRSRAATDAIIEQCYRQIFFHAFKADRDPVLESQLRSGQITVKDFVRALLLSEKFRNDFYRCNSNYRMVDQIVGRVLGRPVHGDSERIALSILIAQRGLPGLVDHLLESREYREAFGSDHVPHQRSRVLAGQGQGVRPFNQQAPRYDAYWREATARRAPSGRGTAWVPTGHLMLPRPAWLADAPSPLARNIWQGLVTGGGFALTAFILYVAAVMLSTGRAG
ncbi:MAG: phycobilisome rod-core linker polypeptide [Cyanobacteriota bacterium]|nr:phycobilisome rod-core linker polypeptide [Cyanobacteriota bacterium]